MDEVRAREVLAGLARDAPGAAVLWRGAGLAGSDIDLVVVPGREADVARALIEQRLSPAPQNRGQVLWRLQGEGGHDVVLDVWSAWAWPPELPPLDALIRRAVESDGSLPVASAEDQLLTFAAEAVAGRPLEKLTPRIEALRDAAADLGPVARSEGAGGLAALVRGPLPASGTLPFGRAFRAGARSAHGRAALARRLGRPYRLLPPAREGAQPGRLVALSGMDGAGKSTAVLELVARLEASGRPALAAWSRVATDWHLLDPVAVPLRRLLGRPQGGMADPTGEGVGTSSERGRDPLRWAWTVVVAVTYAISCRRLAAARARGFDVVCDRWLVDAVIDLEVRYGRNALSERLLHLLVPRPDAAMLLELDATTAARRKPGDQTDAALRAMERRYDELARREGLGRVDARESPEQVVAAVAALAGLPPTT
jgi:thymidylate kinase